MPFRLHKETLERNCRDTGKLLKREKAVVGAVSGYLGVAKRGLMDCLLDHTDLYGSPHIGAGVHVLCPCSFILDLSPIMSPFQFLSSLIRETSSTCNTTTRKLVLFSFLHSVLVSSALPSTC